MVNKSVNILDVIEKLSNLDFQNDVWVKGKYWDRVANYSEAINTLEDYNFFDDLTNNRIGLTKEEINITNSFVKKLLEYGNRNPSYMISDNIWKDIVKHSQLVSEILKRYDW